MAHLMQLARSATANRGRGEKTFYNRYMVHIAELLGFITDGERRIDGIVRHASVLKMLCFPVCSSALCLRLVVWVFWETKWSIPSEAGVRSEQRVLWQTQENCTYNKGRHKNERYGRCAAQVKERKWLIRMSSPLTKKRDCITNI